MLAWDCPCRFRPAWTALSTGTTPFERYGPPVLPNAPSGVNYSLENMPLITSNQRSPKEPLITAEADRALLRIIIAYGGVFVVLFIVVPIFAGFVTKASPLSAESKFLSTVSTLIILTPFFLGVSKLNKTRLYYARKYAEEEDWKAVYYSVESFTQLGQNWMDSTGEAHYLIAIAYERLGQKADAEKARSFVTKHRSSGEWAMKLREVEAGRAPRRISDIKADKGDVVRKLNKTKRRF